MKRLMTLALVVSATGILFAQNDVVNQANKLAGKNNFAEARELIQQALNNPETSNDARTYFVAGDIELKSFENGKALKQINPDADEVQGTALDDALIKAYKYFMQALPLDNQPNEKGQVKPKYTKDIANRIVLHTDDFFNVGGDYFNAHLYYPQAYEAFMIYAGLPEADFLGKSAPKLDPALVGTAFFNAGIAAYSGNAVDESAEAFAKAIDYGYEQPEAYIYQIACWQALAQNDESRAAQAQENIKKVANAGYEKFGLEQPIFLNNLVNSMVSEGDTNGAIYMLNNVIASNPDNSNLYGLRGFVYDRADMSDQAEADYRKAASYDNADFETLKNAAKKLYRVGVEKYNALEGDTPELNQQRQNVKNDYFDEGIRIVERAGSINPNDPELQTLMDSYEYAVTTFFK